MNSVKLLFSLSLLTFLAVTSVFAAEETLFDAENQTAPVKKIKKIISITGNRQANTVSERKMRRIERIIDSYMKKGSDIGNSDVKKEIISKVNNIYKVNSKDKALVVNFVKINKDIELLVTKQFPLSKKELKTKWEKIVKEKFLPAKINSVVTLIYKQGPYKRTITGPYYGLTYYNDGIKIGNTIISIFDLTDEDKNKFDSKLREFSQKKFVTEKINKYEEKKKEFINKMKRDKIRLIIKKNEKLGFINAWGKWRSPEKVTYIMINYKIS